jgi:tellurite resistance protein TerC
MNTSILDMHPGLIVGFAITVVVMLLLDLGVFNKNSHIVSNKEALGWSIVWVSLAMIFSGVVYWVFDHDALPSAHNTAIDKFSEFQAAYWIEKALSVDNLFVFILVFKYFKVPRELHHKALFWGIIGALIFRAIFIFAGVGLINITNIEAPFLGTDAAGTVRKINIVLTIFGFFLIVAGIKSWGGHKEDEEEKDMSKNIAVRIVHKLYKVAPSFDKDKFFTVQNGVKMATPLFVTVAVIELTDLVFAVDSIPAIFAISNDPFILYTSNIFAILGLRSLYFLLANFIHKFSKLPYGLAIILVFIGVKMLIMPWVHIPSPISLAIVGGVLLIAVVASLITADKNDNAEVESNY